MNARRLSYLALVLLLGLGLSACSRRGGGGRGSSGGGGGGDDDDDVVSDDDDDDVDGPFAGTAEALLDFYEAEVTVPCRGFGAVERIGDQWFGEFSCEVDEFGIPCDGAVSIGDGDFEEVGSIECGEFFGARRPSGARATGTRCSTAAARATCSARSRSPST